jgi:hypothetical protein
MGLASGANVNGKIVMKFFGSMANVIFITYYSIVALGTIGS